jgi:hypothetical protein
MGGSVKFTEKQRQRGPGFLAPGIMPCRGPANKQGHVAAFPVRSETPGAAQFRHVDTRRIGAEVVVNRADFLTRAINWICLVFVRRQRCTSRICDAGLRGYAERRLLVREGLRMDVVRSAVEMRKLALT